MANGVYSSAAFTLTSGIAVANGAAVEVRRESDSGLASIFSDRAGTTPIAQPGFVADAQGRFTFYAAAIVQGYSVEVDNGTESHILRNVQVSDPSALGISLIEAANAAAGRDALGATSGVFPIAVGGTGQATASAAFGALKQDATTAATGVVELATQAEMDAGTAGKAATTDLNKITLGTPIATTSGTAHDFTVPAGTRKISINFVGLSTNGTSVPIVQLGDAGGVEATGYLGGATTLVSDTVVSSSNFTTGFGTGGSQAATSVLHGTMTLALVDQAAFTWVASITAGHSDIAASRQGGGSKSLSAELTTVRITTVNGTDTFDAGSVNITFER